MVDLAPLTVCITREEVQASMMTGLLWVTQDGAGKTCIPSSSRYEYSPTHLTTCVISSILLPLEIHGVPTALSCLNILCWIILKLGVPFGDSGIQVLIHVSRALTSTSLKMPNMLRPTDLTRPSKPMMPQRMVTGPFSLAIKATLPTQMSASCVH